VYKKLADAAQVQRRHACSLGDRVVRGSVAVADLVALIVELVLDGASVALQPYL
jgi:hypothetical protein